MYSCCGMVLAGKEAASHFFHKAWMVLMAVFPKVPTCGIEADWEMFASASLFPSFKPFLFEKFLLFSILLTTAACL